MSFKEFMNKINSNKQSEESELIKLQNEINECNKHRSRYKSNLLKLYGVHIKDELYPEDVQINTYNQDELNNLYKDYFVKMEFIYSDKSKCIYFVETDEIIIYYNKENTFNEIKQLIISQLCHRHLMIYNENLNEIKDKFNNIQLKQLELNSCIDDFNATINDCSYSELMYAELLSNKYQYKTVPQIIKELEKDNINKINISTRLKNFLINYLNIKEQKCQVQ